MGGKMSEIRIYEALNVLTERGPEYMPILYYMCRGYSNQEIADEIPYTTSDNYVYQRKQQIALLFDGVQIGMIKDPHLDARICTALTKYYGGPPNYERTNVSAPREESTPPPEPKGPRPGQGDEQPTPEPPPWRWLAVIAGLAVILGLGSWIFTQFREGGFPQIPGVAETGREIAAEPLPTYTPPPTYTLPPTYTPPSTFTSVPAEIVEVPVTQTYTPTPLISPTPSDTPTATNTPVPTDTLEPTPTHTPEATPFPLDFTITEDFDEGEAGIDPALTIGGNPLYIDGLVRVRPGNELTIQVGEQDWRNYTITFNVSDHCGGTSHIRVRETNSDNYAFFKYDCHGGEWWVRDDGQDFKVENSNVGRNPNDPIQVFVEDDILRFDDERDVINTLHESGKIELTIRHDGGWIDNLTISRND